MEIGVNDSSVKKEEEQRRPSAINAIIASAVHFIGDAATDCIDIELFHSSTNIVRGSPFNLKENYAGDRGGRRRHRRKDGAKGEGRR